ncbi:hypothetical protein D4764_10G0005900 [Takifugu flavidus]|uniref:Immunoglobulin domain-containing protein n=1 Tax=Takifugu flavidus TaxID=433684 RepID=A0A5C6PMP3_9TELE|nr:hypothetical protein D4764_10G0005900 [Takifugu flavidus]
MGAIETESDVWRGLWYAAAKHRRFSHGNGDIFRTGAVSAGRWVMFEKPDLCALKGSSVEFRCSYNYSESEMVSDVAWYKGEKKVAAGSVLNSQTSLQSTTALYILENDTGHYYFHFDTDAYGRRSKTSVYLAVTEVRASVHPSSTVRAGWSVRLDCQTSCQNHAIWFKDGEPVTNIEFQAQIGDAGNYTCAIEGDESVQSDPVTLDVQ